MYLIKKISKPTGAMPYVYCAIEGNISAGKSTLLEYFPTICKDMQCFQLMPEPVELFSAYRGHNPLKCMYDNPLREGALVQSYLSKVLKQFYVVEFGKVNPLTKYIISDRSMASCHVFLECMCREKIISSFQYDYLHEKVASYISKLPRPAKTFFIDTPADVCFMRLQERSRPEEEQCTLSYLLTLEQCYQSYVKEFRKQHGAESVMTVNHSNIHEAALSLLEFVKGPVTHMPVLQAQ